MPSYSAGARRKTLLAGVGTAVVLTIAAGVYLYKTLYDNDGESADVSNKDQRIILVVSSDLESADISLIKDFVKKYPHLVVVMLPEAGPFGQSVADEIPSQSHHRVICCDTQDGAVHVIRHLRPDVVLISQAQEHVIQLVEKFGTGRLVKVTAHTINDQLKRYLLM